MKKPLTLMIPFLIASLFVGTATIGPAQMSEESFLSAQSGSLAVASAATAADTLAPVPVSATGATATDPAQAQPAATTVSAPQPAPTAPAQEPAVSKPSQPSRPASAPTTKPVASRGGSSLTSSPAPLNGGKASAVITTAKQYLGVKYVWGGTTPSGFDCSGFSQYVFAKHGISLPRVSRDQYQVGNAVSFDNLQPGDLVFFALGGNGIDHLGIYVGGGQFINASTSKGVTIYALGSYWKSHFVGARRVNQFS